MASYATLIAFCAAGMCTPSESLFCSLRVADRRRQISRARCGTAAVSFPSIA